MNALIVIRKCFLRSMIIIILKSILKYIKKVSSLMDIKFDCEPLYSHTYKYIKTKIETYGGKINCKFQGKGPYIQYVGGRAV